MIRWYSRSADLKIIGTNNINLLRFYESYKICSSIYNKL